MFNYGFDLLMINQWENVNTLRCPTIDPPGNTTTSSFENITDYTTNAINSTISSLSGEFMNRAQPFYCIKNGQEILDDLKIRPVRKIFVKFLIIL